MGRLQNEGLKRFFWDVDFEALDSGKDQRFIVERLLELGDEEATRWLFSVYDKGDVAEILKSSIKISPKSGNYWGLVLGVPRDEIKCLKKPYQEQPKAIWKY